MGHPNFFQQISITLIVKRMLIGAVIGLIVISFFIFSVDQPNPEWGKFWRVRPLIITPLAAAFGILSFYLKDLLQPKTTVLVIVVYVISTLAFIVALWLGIVLGLDGTMWN